MKFYDPILVNESDYSPDSQRDIRLDGLAFLESGYVAGGRVYYKVYPAMFAAITKIRLDVPLATYPKRPLSPIAIRLPEDSTCFTYSNEHGTWSLCYVIASIKVLDDGRAVLYLFAVAKTPKGTMVANMWWHRYQDDQPMDAMGNSEQEDPALKAISVMAEKVSLLVAILVDDAEFVAPEVLARDEPRWSDATPEQREVMIARAKRKGKFGFSIGKEYETMPHFRRPHFALRHTGKGGAIPKIVPVKSSIVHKSVLTRVPTGHYDEQGNEVEPKA